MIQIQKRMYLCSNILSKLLTCRAETDAGTTDVSVNTYNFLKASCTLDASVKIYAHRVDDTYLSSYKILENLSRNDDKSKPSGKVLYTR